MNPLAADQLYADPRFAEAKKLILSALGDHQAKLTDVRPPDGERTADYQQTIEQFGQVRGGKLFYPYIGSGMGCGPFVELADGSVKYDMITGIGVHALGHCHPALVQASLDAAVQDTIMQGNLQQNVCAVSLSQLLLDSATKNGAALSHCFLSTSGAMANENALKLAFQKNAPADRILAFENCFMGRTLALSHITDRPTYRAGLPQTLNVDYVPFFDCTQPAQSTERAVAVLQGHLDRYPGRHGVMCFEMIQGEGGYYPGDRDFFIALMQILADRGIAVLVDEVQTFGRSSELFAFQHYGLDDQVDIVTIGKLSQVCATFFTADYKPKPGLISQTFTGATSSIFAAEAIVRTLVGNGHFGADGRNMHINQRFAENFEGIAARHPHLLSGPYGLGGMVAFQPFDGTIEKAKPFIYALFEAGVIAFTTGAKPIRVRFLPPIGAISDEQIDAVCRIVETTLVQCSDATASQEQAKCS